MWGRAVEVAQWPSSDPNTPLCKANFQCKPGAAHDGQLWTLKLTRSFGTTKPPGCDQIGGKVTNESFGDGKILKRMVKSSAFVISEPLDVPVVPNQVPLFSAKDPTKRVARAVLSIGRLFSAEAQALLARSLAQRVVALLREGPKMPELQNALDALKPSKGWSAAAGIPQVLASVETKGRTALRLAVDGGHWEFVHPLIEACCSLRCPSQDLRSPLTAALEKGQEQALELEKLGFSQEHLQLVGELSSALRNADQLEEMAPRLAFHFAPDSGSGGLGSPTSSPERLPPLPREASRISVKTTDWSPDVFILALDYCRNGRSRRTFLFQADASAAIWRASLQLNLPALARKMAIWIGLSVSARSGDQSRSTLLDAPLYGDDSILGRVVERAAEDAEWLAVARALLSVGASGTATCHGRPLYLFAQEQAEKKVPGFNDLLAPLLARIGQDMDQWRQPTALVEDRTAECPICFETLWTATPTAFVKLVEGHFEFATKYPSFSRSSLATAPQPLAVPASIPMGQVGSRATTIERLPLSDGRTYQVKWIERGGLGYTPWPGSFMLAKYLDNKKDELELKDKKLIELGSGTCSVAGLAAGLLCKEVDLTDRYEVLEELDASIHFAYQNTDAEPCVKAKVLDWVDLEFTETAFRPGQADIVMMSDVVYFPHLQRPLLHTLLFLCNESTLVLWANCDRYPEYEPNVEHFMEVLEPFFSMTVEEERSQKGCGSPCVVPEGSMTLRSLRLLNSELAGNELARAKVLGPTEKCIKRCFF
eukprot:symbB.v1.2.010405.t1/scaffold657.1/size175864/2